MALFLLLPALAGYVWLKYCPGGTSGQLPGDWRRIVDPVLRPLMVSEVLLGSAIGPLLILAIWAILVLALARPGIEASSRAEFSNIAGRVIALDLGAGVDIHAQRLAVTKLIEASPRIPTALVVATADAFSVVPLTTDRAFIDRYLNVIRPEVMPITGQSLRVTLAHGEAVLTRAGIVAGQLVLLTGGPPPELDTEQPARWLRALVVAKKERQDWVRYADQISSRLATHGDLGPVVDDLDRAVGRAMRDGGRLAHLELTPYLIGAALALWLGLFRRLKTT